MLNLVNHYVVVLRQRIDMSQEPPCGVCVVVPSAHGENMLILLGEIVQTAKFYLAVQRAGSHLEQFSAGRRRGVLGIGSLPLQGGPDELMYISFQVLDAARHGRGLDLEADLLEEEVLGSPGEWRNAKAGSEIVAQFPPGTDLDRH